MGSAHAKIVAHRHAVEAMLLQEEKLLRDVVHLLAGGVRFSAWPAETLDLLRAAVTEGDNAAEAAKARALARHLFRAHPHSLGTLLQCDLPPARRRLAERLRADLAGLAPLGAGLRCGKGP